MVDTITSCSTTCWLQKVQPNAEHTLIAQRLLQLRPFSQKKFYEQIVAFIQSKSFELR